MTSPWKGGGIFLKTAPKSISERVKWFEKYDCNFGKPGQNPSFQGSSNRLGQSVTVIELNGPDLVGLFSLYCQSSRTQGGVVHTDILSCCSNYFESLIYFYSVLQRVKETD